MKGDLIMLPESYPVASRLCEYVFKDVAPDRVELLILSKQEEGFKEIIKKHPFAAVHILDEEYYGSVTADATFEFLAAALKDRYRTAWFPLNTFRANAFLFGGVLAFEVKAVNSSLYGKVDLAELPVDTFSLGGIEPLEQSLPWCEFLGSIERRREDIVTIIKADTGGGDGDPTGERPTLGIVEGFAHDLEIFCKYALAASYAEGRRVLDVGGGVGYGSFLMAKFAEEVVYVDYSDAAVDFVKTKWCPNAPNLTALKGYAMDVGLEPKSFDVITFMDVVEHVDEPEALLREIAGLLKDDGVLIVTTPEEDYYPYSVCPKERAGEPEDVLIAEAIWPWHIQALGERIFLPMVERAGLRVESKSYTTYARGCGLAKSLRDALDSGNVGEIRDVLNSANKWSIKDFALTDKRDAYFSAASYNLILRKVL